MLHLGHADEPTVLHSCHTLGGDGGGGVYLATCDGGLEDQLAAEVQEKQGTVTAVQRGQVHTLHANITVFCVVFETAPDHLLSHRKPINQIRPSVNLPINQIRPIVNIS